MVKNLKGGHHKNQARKHVTPRVVAKTRLSEDEYEIYAYVIAISGGANCRVMCQDDKERLCIIRGKFRGRRGKRDNFVARGSWLLVGIREWSSTSGDNSRIVEKCDLLEVYNEADKQKLRTTSGSHWSKFIANDLACTNTGTGTSNSNYEDGLIFTNENDEEYTNLMKSLTETSKKIDITSNDAGNIIEEDEEINIDDL